MQKIDNVSVLERVGQLGLKTVKFDTGSGGVPFYKGCEFAAVLSGLSKLEMAWISYVYLNTIDEYSLKLITHKLGSFVVREFGEIENAERLVELICKERLFGRVLSGRLRSIFIGVPNSTYRRKKSFYDAVISFINCEIDKIEERAQVKIRGNISMD